MSAIQPLPDLWLLSDERNDHALEQVLRSCGAPLAFVFRHYHLPPAERIARYQALERVCRAKGHVVILSDSALTAREWGADGIYGAPRSLYPRRADLLRIAAVHSMAQIGQANRVRANAAMLSPVFPTRSHPGAPTLGSLRFRTMARHAAMPIIALGGMTADSAAQLGWPSWAAIDGLT